MSLISFLKINNTEYNSIKDTILKSLKQINFNLKRNVDKIIQISNDSILGFSGPTGACINICDKLRYSIGDLTEYKISKVISETYYKLRKESSLEEDLEFILLQIIIGIVIGSGCSLIAMRKHLQT